MVLDLTLTTISVKYSVLFVLLTILIESFGYCQLNSKSSKPTIKLSLERSDK